MSESNCNPDAVARVYSSMRGAHRAGVRKMFQSIYPESCFEPIQEAWLKAKKEHAKKLRKQKKEGFGE
jgi:hypothetical protein